MGNDGGRVNVKQSFKGGKGSSFAVLAAHLKLLGRHAVHFLQDQSGQYWSDAAWTWSDVVTVVILFCWAYLDLQVEVRASVVLCSLSQISTILLRDVILSLQRFQDAWACSNMWCQQASTGFEPSRVNARMTRTKRLNLLMKRIYI